MDGNTGMGTGPRMLKDLSPNLTLALTPVMQRLLICPCWQPWLRLILQWLPLHLALNPRTIYEEQLERCSIETSKDNRTLKLCVPIFK